ncbi:OLC1v1026102C2 [Oldenlandia corymbosa var. corymbosa]|nr:OLC1v1026102C2 [Oldenlandia corymbosa var. corymbosa]
MATSIRLRRLGAIAVAAGASYTLLRDPHLASSDKGNFSALEVVKNKIADPFAVVPGRAVQESALMGASSANPLDVLVIGGGATGCGVALDAATRGLRVGLVEREDFSSGTSSRSTKLVHGGVRYLEKAVFNLDYGQLKLVFHALAERKQVIDNAPHLCHALPCMTPCFNWFEVVYYWMGLKMYDLVAGRHLLHLSRYYSADESVELFPTLATKNENRTLKGTVVYYDGQMNDSRLNVAVACSAALAGAAVLNHAEVVSFIKDEASGRIIGARIRDNLSGQEFETYAKVVVNAAGPFCDSLRKMADKDLKPIICPSSGVHIILPDYYSPEGMGLIVPKTKDGRVIFMLPWLGRTVAGTTDSNTAITMLPEPHEDEIQFILDAICDYLNVKVRRSDVLSAWSGIRPLAMDPKAKNTESISRDHVVSEDYPGLVTITGGKWTTYRSMAEDALDAAIKSGKLNPTNKCLTYNIQLMGAEGWEPASFTVLAQQYVRMKRTYTGKVVPGVMDTNAAKHLSHAYGTRAVHVAGIAQNENLGKRLAHGYPFLEAEVAYCARQEYCESAVDFIARRCRLAFLDTDAANRALPRVIEILAAEHKWDKSRQKEELKKGKEFLETFKSSKNAQFHDGKHSYLIMAALAAAVAAATSAFTTIHLSRPAITLTRSTHRHFRTVITSSLSSSATEFNITFAPPKPKPKPKPEPVEAPSPNSDHDSSGELPDQLYIPWIVRDENGNLTLQSTPPARLLNAMAIAETGSKKKKKEKVKEKSKISEAKQVASSVKPKLSKAARRFYNENFRDPPQRLNKVLAAAGVASRRSSDELIFGGKVTVNGSVCKTPQTRVDPLRDVIFVNGSRLPRRLPPKVYFALNKPKGYICSAGENDTKSVLSLFNDFMKSWDRMNPGLPKPRLFTVGRLDVATTGLIIVTNDGDFAQKISHPSSNLTKE